MSIGFKLALGIAIIVGATGYMAYVGASSSWQYYLTTDECVERLSELTGSRMRVSGGVAPGSLRISDDRTSATFQLIGNRGQLPVQCQGILPDNLTEGSEVVVEGRLEPGGVLHGDKVLTKCASKYSEADRGAADGAAADSHRGA